MKLLSPLKDCFLILSVVCVFSQIFDGFAQEGFPYCEPLSDGVPPANTILGGDATLVSDPNGNGVLQLTSNERSQNGYLYANIPFPSSYGIKASFEFFSYGGSGNADGLTFYMFDASVPNFQPGGFGGALGYGHNLNQGSPGLAGAYIGIGLDEYGNFSNPIEGRDGPGFRANSIAIRGPGDGFDGYNYIAGVRTDQEGGLAAEDQFPLSSGGLNTNRVIDPNTAGYRKVFIDLQPAANGIGFTINLEMLITTADNQPKLVSIFKDLPYEYQAPQNLMIGFAASTGSYTNFHEIRNISVEVSDEGNLEFPSVIPIEEEICEGENKEFEVSSREVVLPNENSQIRCLQLYKTLEEIPNDEELDACSRNNCDPLKQELILDEGVVTADPEGGKFTFEVKDTTDVEEISIYYTITDSYGKTSQPASITFQIFEFPGAPVIYAWEEMDNNNRLPASSFRLCEGESQELVAETESEGSYQWYKDGNIIEGETSTVLNVTSEGVYTFWRINEANCSTMSQEVEVLYPPFPIPVVDENIKACGVETVDLRSYFEGYDEGLYDYEVTGPNGEIYLNEELGTVDISGDYKLRMKHKDLDCWSEPLTSDVLLVPITVVADFRFAVIMDNGEEEMIDIFINDSIQYTDLSLPEPLDGEWDFGDGNISTEKNPIHSYAEEGNYQVVLTVFDEHCSSTITKEVNVTRSFRIMYPTAFTPLGQENRYFKPKVKGVVALNLYVFNSWGDLIYTSEDIKDEGWDGTKAGVLQPNGNYIFKVEFTTVEGERHTDSGKFTLIR